MWRWYWHEPPRPPLDAQWIATVRVLAGDGVPGVRDDEVEAARFSDPFGVAVGADGTVYVADAGEAQRIRAITRDVRVGSGGDSGGKSRVLTLAGGVQGFADGLGTAARFNTPSGLAIDARGVLYVADTGNNAIRRITPDGQVTTLAGDGIAGYRDGPARLARFNGPIGVAVDANGRVIVADTYNDRIRAIETDGTVRTIAGGASPGVVDGPGEQARFHTPSGVAVDASGRIHVADTGNGLLRIIDGTGAVTTDSWFFPEGLVRPIGLAISAAGDVYVTDDRGWIVERSAHGGTRTLAGSTPGFRDDVGSDARFRGPTGLAFAGTDCAPACLIVADSGNALVRLVAARSRIDRRLPPSPRVAPHFDIDRFASQPLLWPVAPLDGPHEIAGTLGEARGGIGSERFHAGIDVRMDEGVLVYAVRNGIVTSPISNSDFGELGESIRVGPITYVHVRAGRAADGFVYDPARFVATYEDPAAPRPKMIGIRVKRGARFNTGDIVGSVNRFNHVHMNVGWPGEELNALRFDLAQFEDTVPPTIARGGIRVYDADGQPLAQRARGRVLLSGRVQVVVDAWDQVDGNKPNRRLGPYDLGYQVLTAAGDPAPGFDAVRHTMRFDRLGAPSPHTVRLVYAPGSGIPFFRRGRTRFLFIVTNTFRDGVATQQFWDTSSLPAGDYILRAWVADIRGNTAVANRDLPITITPPLAPAIASP